MSTEQEQRALLARRLRTQGAGCASLGSPLYAELMELAALDVEAGGIVRQVLAGHEGDPGPSALALRLFGGLHRMALDGRAPGLAAHFPSTGGDGEVGAAWRAVLDTVASEFDALRVLLDRGVQTNEVGRSAALLGGFLLAAADSGLPLRILELGASGGLNLRWDHYRYTNGAWAWGDPISPLRLDGHFTSPFPFSSTAAAEIVERRGCDAAPVDTSTEDGRLTLLCFVWPDHLERLALLRGALQVASSVPAAVDRANAPDWLAERLATALPGVATVVYHSVFWQYLTDAGREACTTIIDNAGAAASAQAPFYLLRMEPAHRTFEVRLRSWPAGEDRLLATCGGHGRDIHWQAGV